MTGNIDTGQGDFRLRIAERRHIYEISLKKLRNVLADNAVVLCMQALRQGSCHRPGKQADGVPGLSGNFTATE